MAGIRKELTKSLLLEDVPPPSPPPAELPESIVPLFARASSEEELAGSSKLPQQRAESRKLEARCHEG